MRIAICTILFFLLMPCLLQAQDAPKEITNSIGMNLVLIPRGTFMMGSPESENKRDKNESQHEVTISRDYYLGVTEVTQAQYEKVMGTNPSSPYRPKDSSMYPVEQVSWFDAVDFCKRLSELPEEKKAGRVYRLPTEAEWEYACRAGSKTAFSFGDDPELLGEYAWFKKNSNEPHPVREKKPNAWGLYDMLGNVWELCSDWSGDYPKGPTIDPMGASEGRYRALRGGAFYTSTDICRSAFRGVRTPTSCKDDTGFRVALGAPEKN
jgi:formylglycine-generating enzyme required for sulfatase activity